MHFLKKPQGHQIDPLSAALGLRQHGLTYIASAPSIKNKERVQKFR